MATRNNFIRFAILFFGVAAVLACSTLSGPASGQPGPGAVETGIAVGILSTNLANQQMTLQAVQMQMTLQAGYLPPTQSYQPPTQSPPLNAAPTATRVPPAAPAPLVLDTWTSLDTFYCYQEPYKLTITVRVSDINRGLAVYYHIEDKYSGVTSDPQVIDLHRRGSDTRDATIIGGWSEDQNLQFPPMMSESYFVYQIISDDATYRSPVYSNVTFFPCAQ